MKVFTKLTVFIIIALFLFVDVSNAQDEDPPIDNTGKEFYFGFMPNWHNNKHRVNQENYKDSLYFIITSKVPTKGTLTATRRDGITTIRNFEIDSAGQIIKFAFFPTFHEILGQNDSGRLNNDGADTEKVLHTSFHLTADTNVTLVIHSEAFYTSDACLVYPVRSLRKNYYVFSYESHMNFGRNSRTPSQFLIVASEDSTSIEITPSAPTFRNGIDVQNIVMNKGDTYLVQADIINDYPSNVSLDLTGTKILSDKPIAVFGGHQRANIPYTDRSSRDYLLSQMIPLEAWGRDVFVVPFADPSNIDNNTFDLTKITVSYDDTQIFIGGNYETTMNRGENLVLPIIEPMYITGDKPIRASIYKRSTTVENSVDTADFTSDPFMVLYPPKKQFLKEYNFLNVDVEGYNSHFINLVITSGNTDKIILDGKPLVGDFKPIPNSEFVYASIEVGAGAHQISADTSFGICVYGYGKTNSYGYVGGMALRMLDWTPPEFNQSKTSCTTKNLKITENYIQDTGLESVVITNVSNLDTSNVVSDPTFYSIDVELIDKYNDGIINITATDISGSVVRDSLIVEGFTFTMSDNNAFQYTTLEDSTIYRSKRCMDVTITNYGIVKKDISNLGLKNGNILQINTQLDSLGAGESVTVQVCFKNTLIPGWHRDTLEFGNACFSEQLGQVAYYQIPDTNLPQLSLVNLDCGRIRINAREDIESDYGFGTYEVLKDENLVFGMSSDVNELIKLSMTLIDPFQDGVYEVLFTDLAGNDTVLTGIAQGFTANFVSDSEGDLISFNIHNVGSSKCMDLMIENYGLLPITLDSIELSEKLNFFIPQSQLPFTIPADTALPFKVCFFGDAPSEELLTDEIKMLFDCNEKNIVLDGEAKEILINANSKCDYELVISINDVPKSLSIDNIYPNPVVDQMSMQLGIDKDRLVKIDLVNELGISTEVMNEQINEGVYDFRIDLSDLPSGSYILQIISEENRLTEKVIITK